MSPSSPTAKLELTDWRRTVATLYAAVRAAADPEAGHAIWRDGRDRLFREHPQSPLKPGDPLREAGIPVWPYDPALRWELVIEPSPDDADDADDADGADGALLRTMDSANDGLIHMRRIGQVRLPAPIDATLDVWWFEQYGGGLFVPLRDGTAGQTTYGAGRYLLDTAKGADLGSVDGRLVVDLNFAYHPSCRYDDRWQCPLAPIGNTISAPVESGERLS